MKVKLFASAFLLLSNMAYSGGLDLAEQGTPASVASAGNSNLTNTRDATISMTNPAGMSFTEGDLLTLGIQLLQLDATFENHGSSNSGGDGGQLGGLSVMPGSFYVHQLNEKWHFGIGMNSHTGLGMDYDDEWVGRYHIQNVLLGTVQLTPSISYKVNDKLSIGAGLVIDYAMFEARVALNKPGNLPDGRVDIEEDSLAFGFNLGLMYEISAKTRIGLTYQSELEHDFETHPKFKNSASVIGNLLHDVSIDMAMPQMVKVGVRHEFTDELALLLSGSWEQWSRLGEMGVQVREADIEVDRNYDDTWGAGLGFEYALSEEVLLMTGYRYDSSPVETEFRTADLPSGHMHRIGFGAEYTLSESTTIGAAYEYVHLGSPSLTQTSNLGGTTTGEYKSAIHFLSFGFTYRF